MDKLNKTQISDSTNGPEEEDVKTGIFQRVKEALGRKPTRLGKSATDLNRSSSLHRSASRLSNYPASIKSFANSTAPTPTMPSEVEVEALFQSTMKDALPSDKLKELSTKLDVTKKWQMVLQSGKLEEFNSSKLTIDQLLAKLKAGETALADIELVSTLRIQLTNQTLSWLKDFIQFGGTDILMKGLELAFELNRLRKTKLVGEWLRVIKAFTNNSIGLDEVMGRQDFINVLCLHICHIEESEHRLVPIHILTVIAYASTQNTLSMIIGGLSHLQQRIEEEHRFDSFLKGLASDCHKILNPTTSTEQKVKAQTAVVDGLIFINALLENTEDTEVRIHIRNQIYRRPARNYLDQLQTSRNEAITRQLTLFKISLENDAEWLMEQWGKNSKLFMSARDLFDVLEESFKGSVDGMAQLAQLFQHLLCVRADASIRARYIKFLDCTLESLLITSKGIDPDFCASPVPYLNFKELDHLLNTKEIDALRQENMRFKFQLANLDDQQKIDKKTADQTILQLEERVAELKSQLEAIKIQSLSDIENQSLKVHTTIEKLNQEIKTRDLKILDFERKLQAMQSVVQTNEIVSPTLSKIESIDDQRKIESSKDCAIIESAIESPELVTLETFHSAVSSAPATPTKIKIPLSPPPPPPPPRINQATPPPPPPLVYSKTGPNKSVPASPYPKCNQKLKPMQWKKLFPKDIPGSLWENYNISLFQDKVSFEEVDRLFSMQKSDNSTLTPSSPKIAGPLEIIRGMLTVENKMMISILLGKGPHDEGQIAQALDQMDSKNFTPGLCAQLRKCFWDINRDGSERSLIDEEGYRELWNINVESSGVLDFTEKIILKIARVRGFPYRIKFLSTKLDVPELLMSINNIIEPLLVALQSVRTSDRLKKLYWLTLYVGNYTNQGTSRGNALGFSFDYLTSLKPLKGSDPDSNMLSFLIGLMEKEFPDLLNVLYDLLPVKQAGEKKLKDIEELIARFNDAMTMTKTLVDLYRTFPTPPGIPLEIDDSTDLFISFTKTYLEELQAGHEAVSKRLMTLNEERQATLKYLADSSNMSHEAIFTIFSEFLMDFETAKLALDKKFKAVERERKFSNTRKYSRIIGMLSEKGERRGVIDNVLDTLRSGDEMESATNC